MDGCGECLRSWTPVVDGERAAAAIAVARAVAAKVTNREAVEHAVALAHAQTGFPDSIYWEPAAVAQGDAGLALACAYLDVCFADEGWDIVAHDFLTTATRGAERAGSLMPGLFGGLSGLAFTAWSLSRGGTRYQRLLASLEESLLPQVANLARTTNSETGMPVSRFDVISGLGGMGAYLLSRREQSAVAAALVLTLETLVALTNQEHDPPRWYTPRDLLGDPSVAIAYPGGNLNCGLAHGIPGPLGLMALALRERFEVPGLADAVARTAEWLIGIRVSDRWGVNWPTAVSLGHSSRHGRAETSRAAWCYGTPGIARVLWLAGDALGDRAVSDMAVEAMAAVYRRPIAARNVDSPTFCHGVAGLLQVTLRFAQDTQLQLFRTAAEGLTDQLLAAFDEERALGFAALEPDGRRVDQPGLLDGAPGVMLVLLAGATNAEPSWDRLFLLS